MSALSSRLGNAFPAFALLLICAATYFAYYPAFDAPWQFDDPENIKGLDKVIDADSALDFVVGGDSSAIGRPISLASFLLNLADWPDNPAGFRHINVLLHILNGLLVSWLFLRALRLFPQYRGRAEAIAVVVAGVWMVHPFLASTSLMVVQRMTLLAATFTLAGLLMYVKGRSLLGTSPRSAFAWMSLGIGGAALVGVGAKENAALLPFLAFALELWLSTKSDVSSRKRGWKLWRLAFFGGPLLLLLLYTALVWDTQMSSYAYRPFSLLERLVKESVILWEYVHQVLAPNILSLGPFHDDWEFLNSSLIEYVVAIAAWLAIIWLSLSLRSRFPLIAFALIWFLAGHLLESTVFPLELYFEHRNYLPSLGIVAAAIISLDTSSHRALRFTPFLLLASCVFLLWRTASIWGDPLYAGETWYKAHPLSPRATQFLSRTYYEAGSVNEGRKVLAASAARNPRASDLAVQLLQSNCTKGSDEAAVRALYEDVLERTPDFYSSTATVDSLFRISGLIRDGDCPHLKIDDIAVLLARLLENPRFSSYSTVAHHLHHQLANIYGEKHYLSPAILHLTAAFDARPNPETGLLIAATLSSAGLRDEALASLDDIEAKLPRSYLVRSRWTQQIEEMRDTIKKAHADNPVKSARPVPGD